MFGNPFYFANIKTYVVLFGSLFNNIDIERVDTSNNQVMTIQVPIGYGPKQRYLTRDAQNPDLRRPISQVWPRIAYQITSFKYASDRKLSNIDMNLAKTTDGNIVKTQYNPVPYDIDFEMNIITRNADDSFRIVEQIIPYFTPVLNTSVNLIPDMDYGNTTIPIILNNISYDDNYEDSFETDEFIIWTLNFTMKAYIYGPINSGPIIKNISVNAENINLFNIIPGLTANGQPTSNASASIPANNIFLTDNYGYITEF